MTPASDNNVVKGGKGEGCCWQWPFEEGKGRGVSLTCNGFNTWDRGQKRGREEREGRNSSFRQRLREEGSPGTEGVGEERSRRPFNLEERKVGNLRNHGPDLFLPRRGAKSFLCLFPEGKEELQCGSFALSQAVFIPLLLPKESFLQGERIFLREKSRSETGTTGECPFSRPKGVRNCVAFALLLTSVGGRGKPSLHSSFFGPQGKSIPHYARSYVRIPTKERNQHQLIDWGRKRGGDKRGRRREGRRALKIKGRKHRMTHRR